MQRYFHKELEDFRSRILLMGEKAIEIVRLAIDALMEDDPGLIDIVLGKDDAIDELEKQIDAEAIRYISLRAPVGSDLRLLAVGMKGGHDLERVGDEATSIAKRARKRHEQLPLRDFGSIPEMADLSLAMLRDAINAFIEEDEEKALSILIRDKRVDDLNKQNFADFTAAISRESSLTEAMLDLMFVSKGIERIADHATNIAEEVIYMLRGQDVRHRKDLKRLKKTADV